MMQIDTANLADAQRQAYNAAFAELGLRWFWGSGDYAGQMGVESQRSHLRRYVENHHPHMLKVYDAEFLVNAIQKVMARCLETAGAGCGGAGAQVRQGELQSVQHAVQHNVQHNLRHGEVGF
ncbi:hypothetical protein ASD15_05320 [Massilia sp. Root351]|uniref:hypothetical protein n=1 Tax=Massilia sp. Root351 TaxID=1736522 RepID=UPI0007128E3B|nr:hypothetical protein [Massilia sp. Root351]KQV84607.1 hypothetical protein ASD15_05320 [Massilia sp. Root351]